MLGRLRPTRGHFDVRQFPLKGETMRFTNREQQVLLLLAQGLCNKSIGQQMGISPHTVRDHLCAMLQRTGCANRVQLALRYGQQPPHTPSTQERTRPLAAGDLHLQTGSHPLHL